jgi:hypothetical protein
MPNYPQSLVFLELLAGYVICLLVAVMGLVVVWKLVTGQINLSNLLNEKDGSGAGASMARFQLLVFIFVIALSFFLVVVSNIKIVQYRAGEHGVPLLPEVPRGVLLLLGMSATTYAVGKAIQQGTGTGQDDDKDKQHKG